MQMMARRLHHWARRWHGIWRSRAAWRGREADWTLAGHGECSCSSTDCVRSHRMLQDVHLAEKDALLLVARLQKWVLARLRGWAAGWSAGRQSAVRTATPGAMTEQVRAAKARWWQRAAIKISQRCPQCRMHVHASSVLLRWERLVRGSAARDLKAGARGGGRRRTREVGGQGKGRGVRMCPAAGVEPSR